MTTTSVSRRSAPVCTDDAEARAAEDGESTKVGNEQAKEAEVEQRRNVYLASGTDEGGRSYLASSNAKSWSPTLSDDPRLKASRRTEALDRPLEKDEVGNGIIGALAGGVLAGVRAVAAKALTGGGEILGQMAIDIGKHAAIDAGKHVAIDAVAEGVNAPLAAPAAKPEAPAPLAAPPGRSNASGTSEVVPEAGSAADQCISPPYVIRG